MPRLILLAALWVLGLAGCANTPSSLQPPYEAPAAYQSYSCDQLSGEVRRIHERVRHWGGRVQEPASPPPPAQGRGAPWVLPPLLAAGRSPAQAAEFGRLRSEYAALEQAMTAKKCLA